MWRPVKIKACEARVSSGKTLCVSDHWRVINDNGEYMRCANGAIWTHNVKKVAAECAERMNQI